ncbi:MAG: ABC transporter ATP-binding protein [Burkholderiales bacterium]|nr:ABC transporter ATP-binding protein [Burkholderiales bacterium]
MRPALIEVAKVSKAFGGVVANRSLSLHVAEGSITALIGPNGSGKTTLFNCIVGQHPVDSGAIWFGGREISRLSVQRIARLGMLRNFQQTRVFGRMSALDNMLISASHRNGAWREMISRPPRALVDKAGRLLEFVGLQAKRHLAAGSLSFGQQRLLELAMSLMNEPRALLLDEPTAGINPTLINGLIERLKDVNREFGVTLFVIEHNMRVVMDLAQHVYCLSHGELLADGPPERIRRDPRVIDAYLGAQ